MAVARARDPAAPGGARSHRPVRVLRADHGPRQWSARGPGGRRLVRRTPRHRRSDRTAEPSLRASCRRTYGRSGTRISSMCSA